MKPRIKIDPFLIKLFVAILLASLLPAHGMGATIFGWATNIAIALLFFLHGARLSRQAIIQGLSHWRLHSATFAVTFIVFPLIGLLAGPFVSPFLTPELYSGLLFLCCLPATVQSAIAFASMARGNIPAAICSASASTMLAVFLTPLLVGLVMAGSSAAGTSVSLDAIGKIMLQLLLPFVVGHALRPWIGEWVAKRNNVLKNVDQGSILLVIYTAFSASVINGLWNSTPVSALLALIVISVALFGIIVGIIFLLARIMKFSHEDTITLLFCGGMKSLTSGIPIANILFASHVVGAIVLPVMVFHQAQLIIGAMIAGRYASRQTTATVRA